MLINKDLLSLVLGIEITNTEVVKDTDLIIKFSNDIMYTAKMGGITVKAKLNLDTLTRLYKEWVSEQGYEPDYYYVRKDSPYKHRGDVVMRLINNSRSFKTELEAVIKAAEWVAKEKGLLDEQK